MALVALAVLTVLTGYVLAVLAAESEVLVYRELAEA